jgi:hypothetical protein
MRQSFGVTQLLVEIFTVFLGIAAPGTAAFIV